MSGSVIGSALKQRLLDSPTIGVIGLGYVGLPLAVAFGESGATVIGVDLDAKRTAAVASGTSVTEDIASERVSTLVASDRLRVSSDVWPLKDADAVIICVPTPLGKSRQPDISYIERATEDLARVLRPGQLIVLKSTT